MNYHPNTKSENWPITPFEPCGVLVVLWAAGGALPFEPEPGPGFLNALVEGASFIGVPTIDVVCWSEAGDPALLKFIPLGKSSFSIERDGGDVRMFEPDAPTAAEPKTRSARAASYSKILLKDSSIKQLSAYHPFDPNHPSSSFARYCLAILSPCAGSFPWLAKTNYERIFDVRAWLNFSSATFWKWLEESHGWRISRRGVTKDNNMENWLRNIRGLKCWVSCRLTKRVGALSSILSNEGKFQVDPPTRPRNLWVYASAWTSLMISITEAVGGSFSSSNTSLVRCLEWIK